MKIAKNKNPELCVAYRCKNSKAPGKCYCHKHKARIHKEKNPLAASYSNLKQNAKRRGKDFELTIEQYREFCEITKYIEKKRKSKKSYTIDRIDSSKGYSFDNIQVMTLQDNARKGNRY